MRETKEVNLSREKAMNHSCVSLENRALSSVWFHFMLLVALITMTMWASRLLAQGDPNANYRQPGEPLRPTYEAFRVDKLASEADINPTGDLTVSIPLLSVPNRNGHDWPLTLTFGSNITQRQRASWVGLGWDLEIGAVERTILGRSDDQITGLNGDELGLSGSETSRSELSGRLRDTHHSGLSASDQ
jgi:hypothetical protein